MKKFLAILISVMLVLSLSVFAFAEGGETPGEGGEGGGETPAAPTYSITIDNAVKGETYSAYKVFDVTYTGSNNAGELTAATTIPGDPDGRHLATGYSYTISNSSPFWTDLTTNDATNNPVTTSDGTYSLTNFGIKFVPTTTAGVYNVMPIDADAGVTSAQAQALAAFLATKLSGKAPAASDSLTRPATLSSDYELGTLTLDVTSAGPGYYFVDTTTGSFCSLDTTEPNATIREKNSIPSETKEVCDTPTGTFDDETTIKIGDTAYFKIEVTDSKGTDKSVVVHDTMDSALTLDVSTFVVKVGETTVPAANYTVTYSSSATVKNAAQAASNVTATALTDDCTFEITFTDAYIQSLGKNDVITITYAAELNGNAITEDPFQVNKTHLDYSNQHTVEKVVTVKTYEIDVVKTDSNNNLLDGATFNLYDASTGGNKYDLVLVSSGVYRIKTSADAAASYADKLIPNNGKLTIIGLENGTYYLEEVDHPDGYNPLTARKDFVIQDANNSATIDGTTYESGGVQVINQSGSELPSTGGIGTTIFYIVGAILVLGAAIILIAKRRTAAAEA